MSGTSYTEKKIDFTITLGEGTFGQSGFSTVKLTGLRSVVTILKQGYPSQDRATGQIYGLPPSIMNAVTTLGIPSPAYRINNTILIEAGDSTNGMATVYFGGLWNAYQNFSDSPEVFLDFVAYVARDAALQPVAPLSTTGSTDVATILSGIAEGQSWKFENSGVTAQLPASYFPGTILEQVHAIGRAANIEVYADSSTDPITLAIWPKTGTRGGTQPLINDASGLIGYPTHTDQGMYFRCLFNPNINLAKNITMQSSVGSAIAQVDYTNEKIISTTGGPNGSWFVIGPLSHTLSAQIPGGPWFTDVNCSLLNQG